jgi:hypothetical protein
MRIWLGALDRKTSLHPGKPLPNSLQVVDLDEVLDAPRSGSVLGEHRFTVPSR